MTQDTELSPINNSQVKSWRRCPRQWKYKYQDHLVPKVKALPLYKGSWVHACLETHYKQGDWEIGYNIYLAEYDALLQEEKDWLDKRGHLPTVVKRVVKSYLWYTRNDNWKIIAVEKTFDFVYHGVRFKGTIDLLIQDEDGNIWLIDHKTASTIPAATSFHAMDPQLLLYPWAAKKAFGIEVTGIIWNYIKSKAPSVPKMTKAGRISRSKIVTDYPTMYKFLKANGFDPADFTDILKPLAKQSPFLRRYKLPRTAEVTNTVIREYLVTARGIYNHKPTDIVRNITKDCASMCGYSRLCQAELNGFDTTNMRRAEFEIEDVTIKHGDYDPAEFAEDETE